MVIVLAITGTLQAAQASSSGAKEVQVNVNLDLSSQGATIPQSFLGLSEEWTAIDLFGATAEYIKILKDLTQYGTGPLIIRVGGGSTDSMTTCPPASTYQSMAALNSNMGAKFILSINFESYNLALSRQELQAGRTQMPQGSVVTYELGNEPNYYTGKNGTSNGSQYVQCCYVSDWSHFSMWLSCPNGASSCVNGQFAGPQWGHIFMTPASMDWFISSSRPYLSSTDVHWYTATAQAASTAASLLNETMTRTAMANLDQLIAVSKKYNLGLRIGESNTISNSGKAGVSDAFAAALWSLDSTFEAAAAGAIGMHFHQGNGGAYYSAVLRPKGPNGQLLPPVVRPQWYGFLMFQQAVRTGSRFVNKQISSPTNMIKVWPVQDLKDGSLRIIIINKTPDTPATVTVTVPSSQYGTATLTRLQAAGGLAATSGVTLGGMSYIPGTASEGGTRQLESVVRVLQKASGSLDYTVPMPAGSAALLTVPQAF